MTYFPQFVLFHIVVRVHFKPFNSWCLVTWSDYLNILNNILVFSYLRH